MSFLYRLSVRLPLTSVVLSLHRPAPHQRGFWIDRHDGSLSVAGLGRALLYVERCSARAVPA